MTKLIVKLNMQLGEEIQVMGDFFKIHFIENKGAAFGLTVRNIYNALGGTPVPSSYATRRTGTVQTVRRPLRPGAPIRNELRVTIAFDGPCLVFESAKERRETLFEAIVGHTHSDIWDRRAYARLLMGTGGRMTTRLLRDRPPAIEECLWILQHPMQVQRRSREEREGDFAEGKVR